MWLRCASSNFTVRYSRAAGRLVFVGRGTRNGGPPQGAVQNRVEVVDSD
ncbi:hypothetical protein ATKI12_3659 [Kitasatospora sp. Ki12]